MKFIQARHSTRFKLIIVRWHFKRLAYDNAKMLVIATHSNPITLNVTTVNGIEIFKNINCNRCLYSNHHKNAAKSLNHNSCESYLCQSIVLLINTIAPYYCHCSHVYVVCLALNNFKNFSTIRPKKTHHNAIVVTPSNRLRLYLKKLSRNDVNTKNSIVTIRLSDFYYGRISTQFVRIKLYNLVSSLITLLFKFFFIYKMYLVVNFSVQILLVILFSYFNYKRAIVVATAAYKMCQCHTHTTAFIRISILNFLLWY